MKNILPQTIGICATACVLTFLAGCQTKDHAPAQSAAQPAPAATQASVAPTPAPAPAAPATQTAASVIRIKAGSTSPFTDSSGNVWQGERGFNGGDVVERDASTAIANTKDPGLFLSEHYSMDSVALDVPNGKYLARLYFAETYEGISGPGQRVFTLAVQGREFKDFDVWVKAGGANRAHVESVPVEVTDGKFKITFTSNIENPEINAIELVPQR